MLYDALILGTGTMGVAAALALARRGRLALGVDKASVPNTMSEHFGGARMFRTAYYEHPAYVPLLKRSRELWLELNASCGRTLYHETGGLYLGPARGGEVVDRSAEAARQHGIPHEVLSSDEIAARFPQFRPPAGFHDWIGLVEPAAGVIRPELAVASMAGLARDAGATLGTHEEVQEVIPGDEIEIVTDRARYHGKTLIVTAGAWTRKILSLSDLPAPAITVTRQPIGWFKPPPDEAAFALQGPGKPPCWAFEDEPGSLLYGFPVLPGEDSFRVARHRRGAVVDPDAIDRTVTAADVADFEPAIRSLLPGSGEVARSAVAFYANSEDSHFIIDRLPGHPNIVVAAGFSGHGFKFAPVVGEILADLAADPAVPVPPELSLFSLGRFAAR
jgi:sarcosine oxidase